MGVGEAAGEGRLDGSLDLDAGGYSSIHGVVSFANFLGPLWSLRRLHFSSGLRTRPFSKELRQNLGEVLALLPLPSNEATIESIDRGGGSGYTVVLRLVGETDEVLIQTRWKERDGRTTIIEASHLSKTETAAPSGEAEGAGEETV
jgi:hypothetical protein